MKQLIEYIVSNLVNHPEDVVIEETKTSTEGVINISIQVNPEDVGRVIGRSGKVINAIRQIARIAAIQKGIRVRVDLKDDDQPAQEDQPTEEQSSESQPAEDQPTEEQPAAEEQPTEESSKEETPQEDSASEKPEPAPTLEE